MIILKIPSFLFLKCRNEQSVHHGSIGKVYLIQISENTMFHISEDRSFS